jgi:hypothetical protein
MRVMKFLKSKNLKKWKILKIFFKVFVVFVKIFKSVRRKFALKVLKFRFLPLAKNWLGLKKMNYMQVVTRCVERFVEKNGIIKSIHKWNRTVMFIQIIFIQRNIKMLQAIRKVVYNKLLKSWIKYENEFEAAGNKVLYITKEIKIQYIRKALKILVKRQIKENFESKNLENKDIIFWTELKKKSDKNNICIENLFTKQVFWSIIRQSQNDIGSNKKT